MSIAFGYLSVHDGSTAQTLAVMGTPEKMTGFDTAGESSTSSGDLSVSVNVANDQIDILPGRYLIMFQVSGFTNPDTDVADIEAQLYVGGVEAIVGKARVNVGANTAYANMMFNAVISYTGTGSTNVEVWLRHWFAGEESSEADLDFTPVMSSLTVIRLE